MNSQDISRITRRGFLGAAAGAGAGAGAGITAARGSAEEPRPGHLSFSRDVPVTGAYEVVVCGGGPSGIAAALAAGHAGLRVLLVEGQGQLGGTGISSLVSHWLGGRTSDCRQWVVGGIFRSLAQGAAERGIALIPAADSGKKYQPHGWYRGQLTAGIPFDPFRMAAHLDEQVANAGIEVRLLTHFVDAVVQQRRIRHLLLFSKSGLTAVEAEAVVDATGDADVAARCGCEVVQGREEDGLMTPTSLIFHVSHVDQDALAAAIQRDDSPRFREKIAQLRESGEWKFPYDIFISVQLEEKGTMMINTIRLVGIDGTDGASLSEGMIRGRAEVQELFSLMRKHFPGFAQARLKAVAPLLGVRETRRILGQTTLTVEDVGTGRPLDDTIGFSAYGWDLPDPQRPSVNPGHWRKPPVVPIPYRAMVPRGVENLVCPGRAVSVERPVLGPLRVMAPCMAMGEAAGEAVRLAIESGAALADVDARELRRRLTDAGAIVDWG